MDALTIRKPDDCHLHLREGRMLERVLPWSAERFGRAVVMPNLKEPLLTADDVIAYRQQILANFWGDFQPKMTIYLTPETSLVDLGALREWVDFAGGKWYPKGATHNSASGADGWRAMDRVFSFMEREYIPLLVHGENPRVGNMLFREKLFLRETLLPLATEHPKLRIVMEHITTSDAVVAVLRIPNLWATITPHHLHLDFDDLFLNGRLQPHFYCLPVPNRHRRALLKAATSGNPKFFAGTDSAPHLVSSKEKSGVPGCFTAPFAMQHYAEAFDSMNALDRLEDFASTFGARFYGWEPNKESITLHRLHGTILQESTILIHEGDERDDEVVKMFVSPRPVRWAAG
jgi:dihydroorotase